MTIQIVKAWTDNEFEQTWEVDGDGRLVCAHINTETIPAQYGGYTDPSWEAYNYCHDCGSSLEIGDYDED